MPGFDTEFKSSSRRASEPRQSANVVVVGAGLAGLAAAQRLYESGIEDIIVLDALDRVGGRVHTVIHANNVLELGAQWLHGADENPLYQWLMDKNMLDDFEDASAGFKGAFCTIDGREISRDLVEKVIDIVSESKLSLSKRNCRQLQNDSETKKAGEIFRNYLESKIELDVDLKANRRLVSSIFEWFLRYETIENGCNSMEEVSNSSYTDYEDYGDGKSLNFKHGYKSLLDWFTNHIPFKEFVHLKRQVVNIEMLRADSSGRWMNESSLYYDRPVLVRYCETNWPNQVLSGNKVGGTITCNHVIVTSSLGFLKKNHETFFKPRLPEIKRELINSIGFGTVNKIILQFETSFWSQSNGIKLIWDENDEGLTEFPIWIRDIISFDVVRKQPNLLIGWIGGEGARLMEYESSATVGEVCLRLLHKILPGSHERPSKLISCLRSSWKSNPFICGSYSFQSMESFHLNTDKLQEPLYNVPPTSGLQSSSSFSRVPRVLFAGEATAGQLYSTVHGAIISGWREADRLLDYFSNGNKSNIVKTELFNCKQVYVT